jgi:hypothetical protein
MKKRNSLSITYLLLSRRFVLLIYIYKVIMAKQIRNQRTKNERGSDESIEHVLSKSQRANYGFVC